MKRKKSRSPHIRRIFSAIVLSVLLWRGFSPRLLVLTESSHDVDSILDPNDDDAVMQGIDMAISTLKHSWSPTSWRSVFHRKWCKPEKEFPHLIYLKVSKTSSSTLSGINIRIARNIGRQVFPKKQQACSHTYAHGRDHLDRRKKPFLLWTFLRDPAQRALSAYFHFQVSRRHKPYEDRHVIPYLNTEKNSTFETIAVRDGDIHWGNASEFFQGSIPDWYMVQRMVIEPYNFIGLVERREESLAVMKLLWNLSIRDLIAMPSKTNGGYDDGYYNGTCTRIQPLPRPLPDRWSTFIAGPYRENNIDYIIYSMVNKTLDATIERLGVENVNKEVDNLKWLQSIAEDACLNATKFPCSAKGEHQEHNCYWRDSGCGYQCVDTVVNRIEKDVDGPS